MRNRAFLADAKRPVHWSAIVAEWPAHESSIPPWDKRSKPHPPTPNMKAARGDAVLCAAFSNVNEYQWRPHLIGYDSLDAFGSPSYYALRMFSSHVGDSILEATFIGGEL